MRHQNTSLLAGRWIVVIFTLVLYVSVSYKSSEETVDKSTICCILLQSQNHKFKAVDIAAASS